MKRRVTPRARIRSPTRSSIRRAMAWISARPSWVNTMVSSSRLRNSGRNTFFRSSRTAALSSSRGRVSPSFRSAAEKPSLEPLAVMRAAPTLEVSTTTAFLKSALRPWASVTTPSSMIWSRMPHTSGWAFSISSKSTTQ